MHVYKTLVAFEGGDGGLFKCDTIKWNGGLWLVPEWLEYPKENIAKPKRIVRMDRFQHQESQSQVADYILNYPISKDAFDGNVPEVLKTLYEVIETPDLIFDIQLLRPN